MMIPTDPAIVGATVAITVAVVAWFAVQILGMRDNVRDLHGALFGIKDRPGALAELAAHGTQLKRHSDALRVHGMLSDD